MLSDFVSLNSWRFPGLIYQAEEAVEIVEGGPSDWPVLEAVLRKYRCGSTNGPHPMGAVVGYFEYEGAFWFGVYPDIRVLPAHAQNEGWRSRTTRVRPTPSVGHWIPEQTPAAFEGRVRRAQEYIRAGDIYQANLAQGFRSTFDGNPYTLFEQLLKWSPAPGAAFIDTGNRQILCASPELFLQINGRRMRTRPIKGTRPRSADPVRDEGLAHELINDPKELAELIMITDLCRNDLGVVCEFGSVRVLDLLRLERFPQVFHLVSTVEGRLRSEVSTLAAVSACFPGGSVTGAPKKRAMEIIRELEGRPRGIYTGAIGYFGFDGNADFTMAIRTMQLQAGELSFFAGSGITADSDPTREFDETMHKSEGLRQALASYAHLASRGAEEEYSC